MARNGLQGLGHVPYEKDEYYDYACKYLGYEVLTKAALFDRLGYIPLAKLEKVHRSRANIRVMVGGNRSGKSYLATFEAIAMLFIAGTCGWVVSANYDMAEEIIRKIQEVLTERAGMEKVPRPEGLRPWQFYYGTKSHTLVMGNGSWLQLKSAESPNSMHAVPLDYIIVDEAALVSYQLLETRLMPRLGDFGGWLLAIGTLELLVDEWFQEYYNLGQAPNAWSIESWHHPTEDNKHEYVAAGGETLEYVAERYHVNHLRLKEMTKYATWPLRAGQQITIWNIDIDWLRRQKDRLYSTGQQHIYAARYDAVAGEDKYRVFPKWGVTTHVDDKRCEFDPDLPVYLAVDPGGVYAVAALQLKRLEGECTNELTGGYTVCIIDELYFQNTTTTQSVFELAQRKPWWYNVSRENGVWDSLQGAIDVTAKEQQLTWNQLAKTDDNIRKLHLRGKRVDILPGIQTMAYYIETMSLLAHSRCVFSNLELKRYHYREPSFNNLDADDPKPNKPVDEWNHLIKAIIYFLVIKFGFYGRGKVSSSVPRDVLIRAAIEKRKWMKKQ